MKRKAARVALKRLSKKSSVSNFTKKSTTNHSIRKNNETTRENVRSTVDKRKKQNKEIVQSSANKKVHRRSRELSSSTEDESSSSEEEDSTDVEDEDEEEEEEQPRKKFKKDNGRSGSMQNVSSRVQLKNKRRLTRSTVPLKPKLSTRLLHQRHQHMSKQTVEGRRGLVKRVGGSGKTSSGRGGGGEESSESDNGTGESEEEKVENSRNSELRRQGSFGNTEDEVPKKQLVVQVCRSKSQLHSSNCNDRTISKVSNSKKPMDDMLESCLRKERRLEVRVRQINGNGDGLQKQRLHKNQKEEERYEEEEEEKENEKEKMAGESEESGTVLRGLSVALTDIYSHPRSKAEGQTRLEKETDQGKEVGAGTVDKPDQRRKMQRKNCSTEVNRPIKDVDSDDLQVIINSDDDDDDDDEDDCHKTDDSDDDDVICLSSSAKKPSSAVGLRMYGLKRWSSWNRSRPRSLSHSRSREPTRGSEIQLQEKPTEESTESLSQMPAVDILGIMSKLQESITTMKSNYENKLREKEELITRLKDEPNLQMLRLQTELEFKTQQIEELNQIAERNVEIEAKMNHLLSDRKAYDAELQRLAEIEKTRLKGDNSVIVENLVISSEEEDLDEEETKKKRRRQKLKKSGREDEEEDAKKSEDEANEIEELLIGLKETPDDVSFTLTALPQLNLTSGDSVVPEPRPLPHPESRPLPRPEPWHLPRPLPQKVQSVVANEASSWGKGRHEIRKLVKKLSEETKVAAKLEAERRERVKKERLKHLVVMETDRTTGHQVCNRLVLAFHDDERKMPLVEVDAQLLSQLKPHQVAAVEFMWDSVVESMERLKDGGTGCIVAHCMGLGKTLSVISLLETLLRSDIGFRRCLIVSPLNAVLNWVNEWEKWVEPGVRPPVFDMASHATNHSRGELLSQWCRVGGILIIGYSLFRILVSYRGRSQKLKSIFKESLIDPGPDLVVCDEGHVLKRDSSVTSKCLNRISTRRRIILTGTPLQNNLIEYHCMVNFVRPHLLGKRVEFLNRFVNPITNGQHLDSTSADVQLMKRRAHVLHEMLTGCIHRCDYSTLVKFLPPKYEFVIAVRLSQRQIDLYKKYLDLCHGSKDKKTLGATLFSNYQNLMRIWTHPWLLRMDQIRQQNKPLSYSDDDDDELESLVYTSTTDEEEVEEEIEETEDEEQEHDEEEKHVEKLKEVAEEGRGGEQGVRLKEEEGRGKLEKKGTEHGRKADKREKLKRMEKEEDEKATKDEEDAAAAVFDYGAIMSSLLNGWEEETEMNLSDEGNGMESEDMEESTINSEEERSTEDNGKTSNGTECRAKVIAGEVIRNWQSKTRRKGPVEEEEKEEVKVVPLVEEMWWSSLLSEDDHLKIELSGKILLLFEILRMAEDIGDKVLVFSQSLLSLDIIEDFLKLKTDEAAAQQSCFTQSGCVDDIAAAAAAAAMGRSVWIKDEDYVRMDGSTAAPTRKRLTANFNDNNNTRLRLFLISTKAGGLGINLASANRVIIFDASWNPSHDIQSIFRVYRFGQSRPVFVYRFLAQGTMEEKIYDRQVTKETLSHRVLDEQQINRHFTAADLSQLYAFNPDQMDNRPTLPIPKDRVLMELLSREEESRRWIVEYHDHDSLLERRPEEDLTEDERKAAWEEYEHERQATTTTYRSNPLTLLSYRPSSGVAAMPAIDLHPSTSKTSNNSLLQQPSTHSLASLESTQMTTKPISVDIVDLATAHLPPHLKNKLNFQLSHLPRVIEEIIRYNPSITVENLQKRINSFVGINFDQTT